MASWPLTTNAGVGIGDFSMFDNLKFLHIFYVKLPALTGGGSALRQCFAPGKDFSHFYIAPLDPALTGGGSDVRQCFAAGSVPVDR